MEYRIERLSNQHVRIAFDEDPSRDLTLKLTYLCEELERQQSVREAINGYRTLLIDSDLSTEQITDALARSPRTTRIDPSHFNIELSYSGGDLEWISQRFELDPAEIVRAHSSTEYHVVALGSPGFVYLSLVPDEIPPIPRLETPRSHVAAGSVGIAGRQTGIYGAARPGGWRIIGTCLSVPTVRPGDSIRFIAR